MGSDGADADPPRLGVVPEERANALPVHELDLLVQVDAGEHLRDDLLREAQRGEQRLDPRADVLRLDAAVTLLQLGERDDQLLVADEDTGVAPVVLPLPRHRAGEQLALFRIDARAEVLLDDVAGDLAIVPLPPRLDRLLDLWLDAPAPLPGVHPEPHGNPSSFTTSALCPRLSCAATSGSSSGLIFQSSLTRFSQAGGAGTGTTQGLPSGVVPRERYTCWSPTKRAALAS